MGFIGINQFGSLTTNVGRVLNFEDFDINGDGIISEDEYSNIFKQGGFDTVEFSTVDKNNNKEISKEEFAIWEQEVKMQEAVNNLKGQIAKDFIGANSKYVKEVMETLGDYIKEFSEEYVSNGNKTSEMALKFQEILPQKYVEIKEQFLTNSKTENDSKKFLDAWKEFNENVPDRTTTIEEKELAIKYIDEMLACSDIPDDMKVYWSIKKDIINAEILSIKNKQLTGSGEKYDDIQDELNDFVKRFRDNAPSNFNSVEDRVEYYITYNNTCISFYQRMLGASDISNEQREYCQDQISDHIRDLNYQLVDLNNARTEKGEKTESFRDVIEEMRQNVPDQTTTYEEKELAISYIDRMLSCDDIPDDAKAFWTKQKAVIENEQKQCLPKEERKFVEEWWTWSQATWNNGNFPSLEDAKAFCEKQIECLTKILTFKNLSSELRFEYNRMLFDTERDLSNIKRELEAQEVEKAERDKDYEDKFIFT